MLFPHLTIGGLPLVAQCLRATSKAANCPHVKKALVPIHETRVKIMKALRVEGGVEL